VAVIVPSCLTNRVFDIAEMIRKLDIIIQYLIDREDSSPRLPISGGLSTKFSKWKSGAIDLAQRSELTLANIQEEISNHCINKEKIAAEIANLQNRGENLEAEIVTQKINRTELQEQISALQERLSIEIEPQQYLSNPEPIIEPDIENQAKDLNEDKDRSEEIENTRQHRNCRSLYSSYELVDRSQDFMNPQYTKKIWQEQILPFWLDRDKPTGHRFLVVRAMN
jgi:hypothetical protein